LGRKVGKIAEGKPWIPFCGSIRALLVVELPNGAYVESLQCPSSIGIVRIEALEGNDMEE